MSNRGFFQWLKKSHEFGTIEIGSREK